MNSKEPSQEQGAYIQRTMPAHYLYVLPQISFLITGVSNPRPMGLRRPRGAMSVSQHKILHLLKTFFFRSSVFPSVCVFNVWPQTILLLPAWLRDAQRLDTPARTSEVETGTQTSPPFAAKSFRSRKDADSAPMRVCPPSPRVLRAPASLGYLFPSRTWERKPWPPFPPEGTPTGTLIQER